MRKYHRGDEYHQPVAPVLQTATSVVAVVSHPVEVADECCRDGSSQQSPGWRPTGIGVQTHLPGHWPILYVTYSTKKRRLHNRWLNLF